MKRVRKALNFLAKYRAWRYALYAVIYFVWIPLRYPLVLVLGWIAAVLEETRETTEALVNEYRTLACILRQERKNAKHDG